MTKQSTGGSGGYTMIHTDDGFIGYVSWDSDNPGKWTAHSKLYQSSGAGAPQGVSFSSQQKAFDWLMAQ